MDIKKEMAIITKQARKNKGLTQEQLATMAGISARYLQDVEAAKKMPTIETTFKLSKALDCDFTELIKPVWAQWKNEKD